MNRRLANDDTRVRVVTELAESGSAPDPIDDLIAFHGEIRSTLSALGHVVNEAKAGRLAKADANRVMAFFDGPLLWHDEDEEVSVLAHLRRLTLSASEASVLEATTRGHDRMEELIEATNPVLSAVVAGVALSASTVTRFADDSRKLTMLLDGHMHLEEHELFPLAKRRLSVTELEGIGRDVSARHQDDKRTRRAVKL